MVILLPDRTNHTSFKWKHGASLYTKYEFGVHENNSWLLWKGYKCEFIINSAHFSYIWVYLPPAHLSPGLNEEEWWCITSTYFNSTVSHHKQFIWGLTLINSSSIYHVVHLLIYSHASNKKSRILDSGVLTLCENLRQHLCLFFLSATPSSTSRCWLPESSGKRTIQGDGFRP